MFKKEKHKTKSIRIDTLIGHHTHIEGDINFTGGLRIDGSVTGNINASGDIESMLTISEQGIISGEVRVPNLLINGSITGNVFVSEHVELAPKAKINGNVYYHLLEMAMGAEVNGQLIRSTEKNENILDLTHEDIEAVDTFQIEQKTKS